MSVKEVKVRNGEAEATVLVESLAVWERNGWTAVDDGDSEKAEVDPSKPVDERKTTEPKTVVVTDGGNQ